MQMSMKQKWVCVCSARQVKMKTSHDNQLCIDQEIFDNINFKEEEIEIEYDGVDGIW